jgi:hypothetical protein
VALVIGASVVFAGPLSINRWPTAISDNRAATPEEASFVNVYLLKAPFRTRPSWANALVVGCGCDRKRKPVAFAADHVMVAWLAMSSPAAPAGAVTGWRPVTGPFHRMSKLQLADTEVGFCRWSRALGMLKKSLTGTLVALIRAVASSKSTCRPSPASSSGTVQNNPPG